VVTTLDEGGGFLCSRIARVRELCASSDRFLWTDQYSNVANPLAHYRGTGPEIYEQMQRDVDAVLVPVSTWGTLAGIARFFRENSRLTRIIAVDARGSVVFGDRPRTRLLTGIGASRASTFLTPGLYDDHLLVGDEEAFAMCRVIDERTGLRLGGSSGAVLVACVRHLRENPDVRRVVCVCADDGNNYASSIFDDSWWVSKSLDLRAIQAIDVDGVTLSDPAIEYARPHRRRTRRSHAAREGARAHASAT
jgi:cysteine synthase